MPLYDSAVGQIGGAVGRDVDTTLIPKAYFPNMKNIMKYGDFFGQRPGRTSYGSVSGIVIGYYHFKIGDYNKFLLFTTTGVCYRSSAGWTDVTGSELTGAITNFISYCTVYDSATGTPYVVFSNGKDNIRKYTGTGNTADMSAWTSYKARFVLYYQGYLLAFHLTDGGVRYGFRFRSSDIDLPNDTTGTNSKTYNMTKDQNISDIVGVQYFDDYVAVFKTDCIYLLWLGNSDDQFTFDVAVHNIGLRAPRAVAKWKNGGLFFLGYDDVYYWASPNSAPQGLTDKKINERLFKDTTAGNMNRAVMIYDQRYKKVKLYVPEGEYLNKVYCLDTVTSKWSWWIEERLNITAVGSYLQDTIVSIDDLTSVYGTIDDMAGVQIDDLSGALKSNYPILIEGDKDGNSWYEDEEKYNDGNITIKSSIETKDDIYETSGVPFSSDRSLGIRFEAKGFQASGDRIYVYYSEDEGKTWTAIEDGLSLADFTAWTGYVSLTDEWAFYEAHVDVMTRKIRYKIANEQGNSTFLLRNKIVPIIEEGDPE